MKISSRSIFIAFGWALFQSYFQFSLLIVENSNVHPFSYMMLLIVSMLACSLYSNVEQALKYWILSIAMSILLVFFLLYLPIFLGVLEPQLAPIVIAGALQPLTISIILISSLGLLGCFLGQVLRNKYL